MYCDMCTVTVTEEKCKGVGGGWIRVSYFLTCDTASFSRSNAAVQENSHYYFQVLVTLNLRMKHIYSVLEYITVTPTSIVIPIVIVSVLIYYSQTDVA